MSNHDVTSTVRVSANRTTTSTTAGDVTGALFAVAANETWCFEFNLQVGCDGVGGVKFAFTVPSGATFMATEIGTGSLATTTTSDVMSVSGTLGVAFVSAVLATGWVRMTGVIVNGSSAGNLQLQFASATITQTSTVFANSYGVARRM